MDFDTERPKKYLKRLLNKDLQSICKAEGMTIGGTKATLQKKIVDRLDHYALKRDTTSLDRMRRLIGPGDSQSSNGTNGGSTFAYGNQPYSHGSPSYVKHNPAYPRHFSSSHSSSSYQPGSYGSAPKLRFAHDPFHRVIEPKCSQLEMPAMLSNRNTVSTRLVLNEPLATELREAHGKQRIAVYCSNDFKSSSPVIAFPQQCEIKVNGEAFSGNLRGLKKKAGTTHPADITPLLRKRPATYPNEITLTYAGTDKKFAMLVYLIEYTSPEELVEKVKRDVRISKEQVLGEMQREANDPDLVAGSRVMSLSCPVGGGRIKTPIRSQLCAHNQCFDAHNFFLAQLQAPQWECPVCYKASHLNRLVVDEYFLDILTRTAGSGAFNVTVQPDGSWEDKTPVKKEPERPKKKIQAIALDDTDDSDDEVSAGSPFVKPEPVQTPTTVLKSPLEAAGASVASAAGSKRRVSEVIDLTLSDSDDEPPARPSKQVNTGQSSGNNQYTQSYNQATNAVGQRGYDYDDRGAVYSDRRPASFGLPHRSHGSPPYGQEDYSRQSLPPMVNSTSAPSWDSLPSLDWGSARDFLDGYR